MTNQIALTDQEKQARLDVNQLKQLVGLVEYDLSNDPFPVTGWDAIGFVVGNATEAASYFQSTWGMESCMCPAPVDWMRRSSPRASPSPSGCWGLLERPACRAAEGGWVESWRAPGR